MDVKRQIWKYYAYQGFSAISVLEPFLILFLVGRGISYTTISLGAIAMASTTILIEVPSGYLGDAIGRRRTILIAKVVSAVSTSLWFFVGSIYLIVIIYILQGISVGMRTGSDTAWLYDILEEYDSSKEFTKIRSQGSAISQWTYGISGILGASFYLYNRSLAFILAALTAWTTVLIVLTLPENAQYRDEDDESPVLSVTETAGLTKRFLSKQSARPLILLGAVYTGAMYTGSQFIQPLVVDSFTGSALTLAGYRIPEILILSFIYASLATITGFTLGQSDKVKEYFGVAPAVIAVYAVGASAMLLPAVDMVFAIPAVIIFRAIPPMAAPIRNGYLHEHADTVGRATEMSAMSFTFAIARIPVLLVGGRIADLLSPQAAFSGLGLYVISMVMLIVLLDRPLTTPAPGSEKASPSD